MLFLVVLVLATGIASVVRKHDPLKTQLRIGLATAMVFAGAAHLFMPTPFVQHLPEWVPGRTELIYFTGFVEIGLGLALVWPARWRALAGLALAAYLVSVFPSNIYVAAAGVEVEGQPGGLYPWLRLPFQALFIWLALWTTDAFELAGQLRRNPPAIRAVVTRRSTAAVQHHASNEIGG